MNERSMSFAIAMALTTIACGADDVPPRPEVLLVVDTDLPVPWVADRLRVDLYDETGSWFESRDIARPDARDWPLSFSIYSEGETKSRNVWVRLRLYPEGRTRDYLGERRHDWGGPLTAPEAATDNLPRLMQGGRDITPRQEPEPLVTVDRLLLLKLEPASRGRMRVILHGACAGTMPLLSEEGAAGMPVRGQAQSCIATEKERVAVSVSTLERDNMDVPTGSSIPEPSANPCGQQSDPSRICIPGGFTILGSVELSLFSGLPSTPERIVHHAPFLIDVAEVSVGGFREALSDGFTPPLMPTYNSKVLGNDVASTCTFSETPVGREAYGLSCINWQSARAYCEHLGGDLPSEAQWEHMATLSGDRGRSFYSWGDEAPHCERAVYGRLALGGTAGVCQDLGTSPQPLERSASDVSALGVIGAAGGLSEWTRDNYQDYRAACWGESPLHDPLCDMPTEERRSIRGASWVAPPTILPSAVRFGASASASTSFIGFRCVYPVAPQP